MSELRAHLSDWLERARTGEDVVVTERGSPVARIVGVSSTAILERLTSEGVISRPLAAARPKATGRRRVKAQVSVSELVSKQRR